MPYVATARKFQPVILMRGPGMVRMPTIMLGAMGQDGFVDPSLIQNLPFEPFTAPILDIGPAPSAVPAYTLSPDGSVAYFADGSFFDFTSGTSFDAGGNILSSGQLATIIPGEPSTWPAGVTAPIGVLAPEALAAGAVGTNAQGQLVNAHGQPLSSSQLAAIAASVGAQAISAAGSIVGLTTAQRASAPPGATGVNAKGQYVNAAGQPIDSLGHVISTSSTSLIPGLANSTLAIGGIAIVGLLLVMVVGEPEGVHPRARV